MEQKDEKGLGEFRAKLLKFMSIDEVNALKAKAYAFKSSNERNGVKFKNPSGTNRCENKFEHCFNCLFGQLQFTALNFSNFNGLHSVDMFAKTKNLELNSLDE